MNDDFLYRVKLIADKYKLDSTQLRPCMALALDGESRDGGTKRRTFLVAVELRSIGETEERTREILRESGYFPFNQIDKTVRSAFKPNMKRWGCLSAFSHSLQEIRNDLCIGSEYCYWLSAQGTPWQKRAAKSEERNFTRYGWHFLCSPYEQLLYQEIIHLEKMLHIRPGGLLLRNHDALAFALGCSRRTVCAAAQGLVTLELIHYKPGGRNSVETRASEFKRIIPIPEPGPQHYRKLEKFHHYARFNRFP